MKVLFPLILFLVLFALVFGENLCPPPNYIKPCECISGEKPVAYKCSGILDQDTIERVFKGSLDWPLNELILEKSSLLYVNKTLIETKEISTLRILDSRFTTLFNSPPEEGNKIKTIFLFKTTLTGGLDWKLLKNLNLDELDLAGVQLKRIGNSFIENMKPTLKNLAMQRARIQSLHNEAFAKLTSLSLLDCRFNSIKFIKRSMFPQDISILYFQHNKIEILPDDIFSNMPKLELVYLVGNQITAFTSAVWERVFDQLNYVDLKDNPILCDCQVKWYTKKSRNVYLSGKCAAPDDFKGRKLSYLTKGDFHYCGH